MSSRLAALATLALAAGCGAGCGVATDDAAPGPLEAAPDPLADLTAVDPPHADDAVARAVAFYERSLGVELPPVGVTWVAERIPHGATTVIGLHRGCDDIWITWWPEAPISRAALAHEIGHCARTAADLGSDGGHTDASWWAREHGLVARANRELRAAGL